MNILEFIEKRADFLHLYNEKISDLQSAEGDWSLVNKCAFDLGVCHGTPAFADAVRLTKIDLGRRFDELFAAQNNLVRVTYRVSERLFESDLGYRKQPGIMNMTAIVGGYPAENPNFPNAPGVAVSALMDVYLLGFTWNFNAPRANDKRLFFETLKYIHGVWRDTTIGAQIADGDSLDRELQWIETESGELQFSVVLNAYQYCKLIGFSKSFDLFNAALIEDASGVPVFVQREKELFWTEKVEVL